MRLIDADALGLDINRKENENFPANRNLTLYAESLLAHAPTIDAVPVERLEQVKNEILDRMDEFITEYRIYSESTVDNFGRKTDAMDVARRLVNASLTDLCSYGERKDGEG